MNDFEIYWADRQPGIGPESDAFVQSKLFRELYDFANEYRLQFVQVEQKIRDKNFRFTIHRHRNCFGIIVGLLGKYSNESRGEVSIIPASERGLVYESLDGVEWVFEDGTISEMQRQLTTSNLSSNLQDILTANDDLTVGRARVPFPDTPEFYQVSVREVSTKEGDYWIIESKHFDESQPHEEQSCVVRKIKK